MLDQAIIAKMTEDELFEKIQKLRTLSSYHVSQNFETMRDSIASQLMMLEEEMQVRNLRSISDSNKSVFTFGEVNKTDDYDI